MNMTFKAFALTATVATLAVGLTACNQASVPGTPAATTPPPASTPASPAPETTEASTPAPSETPEETPAATPTATESETSTPAEGALGTMRFDPAPNGQPGAAACYDADGKGIRVQQKGPEITKGAVEAWLCGEAPDGYGSVGPIEPLITDVDSLVEDYLALPELTDDEAQAAASIFRIVFVYPDGTRRVIEGDNQESTAVWGGPAAKQGSEEFAAKVRGHWLDQRYVTKVGVPGEVINLVATCPGPEHTVLAHPITDVSAGWICYGDSHETVEKTLLDADLAKRLAAALEENSTPIEPGSVNQNSIHLATPWGESIMLQGLQDEEGFQYRGEQGIMKFTVPAELEREVNAAVENA